MDTRSKKLVLVIHGSPRREGNTDIVLAEVIKGIKAKEPGVPVRQIYASSMKITPCRECRACDATGKCIIGDDMQQLYPLLPEADVLILSSPIFFYGVSGWAKAIIDRCQALWAKKYICRQPLSDKAKNDKGGWFVAVGATKGKRLFEGARLTATYFFDALDTSYRGSLLIRGVDGKGDVLQHPEELQQAFPLGCTIAQEILQNR